MKYPAYPKYKDSGVEWLGKVPEHWEIDKLKHVSNVIFSNVDKHKVETEIPVSICNYVDVYKNEKITLDIDFMQATATPKEIEKYQLHVGDVLVTKDSESPDDIAIPALVVETRQKLICGYHLALIRPKQSRLHSGFLYYLHESKSFRTQYEVQAKGITRFGLSQGAFKECLLPIPPISEQTIIARFLDKETAKIDALISKQEKMIELLKEKRQALISHVVTKGLNPNVPMKDSGVDWLGEVPKHWDVKRFKYLVKINPSKKEISHLPRDIEVSFLPMEAIGDDGSIKLDKTRPISEVEQGYTYFRNGDVVLAKITPCFENGKGALMKGLCSEVGFGTTELIVFRSQNEINEEFLYYLTHCFALRKEAEGWMYGSGGQKRVPEEFFLQLKIGVPPLEEQEKIVTYIKSEIKKIDVTLEKALNQIELLKEKHTSLITAAVTGKIDVRGLVQQEVNEHAGQVS